MPASLQLIKQIMAATAHKTDEEKKEYFDPEDVLDKKIDILVQMVMSSQHMIAFTGAGISTSCGIPDFRSGVNTVLPTGPGAWEKLNQKQKDASAKKAQKVQMHKALPSYTHMALVQLNQAGYLKYLISQNVDGLHRRSGFPPEQMAELHGNTNLEKCQKCKKEYLRDFRVRTAQKVHDHVTGRKCEYPKCKGPLADSIINFGENLPERDINDGFMHSELADLCLTMGSSLRVTPAANMPETVGKRKKNLVVINIQKTPLDPLCALRIFALCDKVMEKLMAKLQLKVEKFRLKRRLEVLQTKDRMFLRGIDSDGCPYSFIKDVKVKINGKTEILTTGPYEIKINQPLDHLDFLIGFYAHYNEPELPMTIPLGQLKLEEKQTSRFQLEYDPYTQKWVQVFLL